MRRIGILMLLASGGFPVVAVAQKAPDQASGANTAPADDQGNSDEPDIIVQGQRNLPGSVIGDIPPEQQLGPADIRSYGVSSVSDLLNELSPQTSSGRGSGGAPVVLLNGKRISSFAEIRDIPTEAIARVDILPEEVALKYGYRADQKVVNIVLRRRFRATTLELADRVATAGGRNNPDGELDRLKIRNDNRLNLHLSYQASSALTEAERDITAQPSPFAIGGNIVGLNGGEIDPALSALAGTPVTIAGVPAMAANGAPTLGNFASTANQANFSDQGAYRTLLPSSRDFSANAVYARPIGKVSATLNGRIEVTDSTRTNGLPTVALALPAGNPFSPFGTDVVVDRALNGFIPLEQQNSAITTHLGTTFNGTFGKWRWSVTGNYDRSDTKTFTDTGVDASIFQARINAGDPTANPFGSLLSAGLGVNPRNRAYAVSNEAGLDALFNGPLFALPAGNVSTSIRVGADTSGFDSRSYRANLTQTGSVSRGTVNGQINIDVPIASKTNNFLGAIGRLSANFNLAEDHLSDFGTLQTLGYGANWAPIDGVRVIASHTDQDRPPTAQQLGNPTITTPNIRVFDYIQGTTANVTTLSGGNPGLTADNNHVTKIGLTLKPWSKTDLTITANYITNRTDNPIAAFPTATAAIEAAFPSRFTRDSAGQLMRIDMRPINFAESDRSQLRWGINFSKPLKSKIQKEFEAFRAGTGPNPLAGLQIPRGFQRRGAGAPGAAPAGGASTGNTPGAAVQNGGAPGAGAGGGQRGGPGGRGGFGGGRGGGFGGGGQGGGRLQFALYHTWHFKDEVLVQDGGPKLDLLDGDAIAGSGGQSRHEFEAQAGYTNNGTGFRFSGKYGTGTRVNGGTLGAPEPLDFSGLGTLDLRVFADLGQKLELLKKHPWMRGTRITLGITNIFDSRQRVTDATGSTPISYQPDYLDPLGRTVRLSIRKLFL